jgi:hypothetical protein
MHELNPYSADELRRMRRLIIAAGLDIAEWTQKLRRSADFLQSLSPGQAAIVAQQAAAIAADPTDVGADGALEMELLELAAIPEEERLAYISRQIIEIRRVHFPGPPDEP